ncbi:MAG: hypothetical protein IBX72_10625 [Nitrospirae bacterium]|jgi:hypothetical protein|nr:hypothetical protein [Nitrospirota bacterium]
MHEMETLEDILRELDKLRQWCEDIEERLQYVEETIRQSRSGVRIVVPQWYKSWLSGKIDA